MNLNQLKQTNLNWDTAAVISPPSLKFYLFEGNFFWINVSWCGTVHSKRHRFSVLCSPKILKTFRAVYLIYFIDKMFYRNLKNCVITFSMLMYWRTLTWLGQNITEILFHSRNWYLFWPSFFPISFSEGFINEQIYRKQEQLLHLN